MPKQRKVNDINQQRKVEPIAAIEVVHASIANLNFAAKFLGLAALPNWRWSPPTYFTAFTLFYCVLCTVVSVHSSIAESIFKLLELMCIFGLLIPIIAKLRLSVEHSASNYALIKCMIDIAILNPNGKRAEIIIEYSKRGTRLLTAVVVISLIGIGCYGVFPIYDFFGEGHYTLFIPVYIPLMDHTTSKGYAANILQQIWFSVMGAYGSILFDCFLTFILSNIDTMVALIEDDFNQLDKMAENPNISDSERTAFLINLLTKLYDINGYFNSINKVYSNVILYQVTSGSAGIALALFVIVANDWKGGIGFVMFMYTEMFLMCFLGTLITTANDRLTSIIYASKWYLYSIHDQKLILTMLTLSQNGSELWIGSLAPLTLGTGMKITSNIYSYFTALLNFIEE